MQVVYGPKNVPIYTGHKQTLHNPMSNQIKHTNQPTDVKTVHAQVSYDS